MFAIGAVAVEIPHLDILHMDMAAGRDVGGGEADDLVVFADLGAGGDVDGGDPPLVRVHSECLTGDILGSLRCDCGPQLDLALQMIAEEGRGVVVYLRGHEGRGIGIGHKMRAYALQDQGLDTVEANAVQGLPVDSREYGVGANMLADLGVAQMRIMTNNPAKLTGLDGYGLEIVDRVPIVIPSNPENEKYLETKRTRMGHNYAGAEGAGDDA